MTLSVSGYIGLAAVNLELGRPATQWITMNDPDVRRLAGAPSGLIWMSQLHGKSNIVREPASGAIYQNNWTYWLENTANRATAIYWGGVSIADRTGTGLGTVTVGNMTYANGNNLYNQRRNSYWYDVYRLRPGP